MPKPKVKRPELKTSGNVNKLLERLPKDKGYTKNKLDNLLTAVDQTQDETVEQALARRKLKKN